MLFSHSQDGASSHTSLPSFALPDTVLSAWNVHVHLADLENSDSPLNENHSGCFWLQETHTSKTFIFTLQKSEVSGQCVFRSSTKTRGPQCSPSSHVTTSACYFPFPNGCHNTRHCTARAGSRRVGYKGIFCSYACLLSDRKYFPEPSSRLPLMSADRRWAGSGQMDGPQCVKWSLPHPAPVWGVAVKNLSLKMQL